MAEVKEVTDETFEADVLQSDKPVLVDFWAPWCGPCRMVAPIVESLAQTYEGKVDCRKVNVDEAAELANKFGIRSIPTLIVFKGGEAAERIVGAQPEEALASLLDKVLEA